MTYGVLPNAGIEVSAVALGCWQFAGGEMWGDQAEADSVATVHAALDAGITLFDTAEAYGGGLSETILGKALRGRRPQAIVATKASGPTYSPQELERACEGSLRRLGTDFIDIYQLHWPRPNQVRAQEILEGVRRLKESGKIRHFGVCNFGSRDLGDLGARVPLASNQLAYSLLWRGIEARIVPLCARDGMGILAYSALVHGLLSGRYRGLDEFPAGRARTLHFSGSREGVGHGQGGQEELTSRTLGRISELCAQAGVSMLDASLAWVMHRPQVTSVLAGARTPEQARQNARVAELDLSGQFLDSLTAATEELGRAFGARTDMWQVPGRMH